MVCVVLVRFEFDRQGYRQAMYIGIGALILILLIVVAFYLARRA
jgi:hypothetical protein